MSDINPMVSIVIPVYNGSDYLGEAIGSALAQTYPNIEIVVVNDGSRDEGATERIALSYGAKIRYFSKENGGVASALNMAIREMRGEYFSWLSHDDLYTPNKIETQIRALAEMEDCNRVILYSDLAVFTDDPRQVNEVHLPEVPPESFRYFLTVDSSLHGCTLLVPKSAFDECGVFNEELRTTQDYDLWFRMANKYRFVHLPVVLVKARRHGAQGSVKMKDTVLAECNALFTGFVGNLSRAEIVSATNQAIGRVYANVAIIFWRRGFHQAAKYSAQLALRSLSEAGLTDAFVSIATLLRAVVFGVAIMGFRWLRNLIRTCL